MRQYSVVPFSMLLALLVCHHSSGHHSEGLKERLAEVTRVQEDSYRRFLEEYKTRTSEETRKQAVDLYNAEVAKNTGKILDKIRENPRAPEVVEALRFVIKTAGRGPGNESYQAMEILLRDHVRDAGLGVVCGNIFHFWHSPLAESLLRDVLEKNPNRDDRGLACHTLSYTLNLRAKMVRRIRREDTKIEEHVEEPFKLATERLVMGTDPEALEREAETLLERVIAEFSDVKFWFNPKQTIGAIAEGELFAIRKLSIGQAAPEITGKDHEGKSFALSDYRGKVVLLTFSASWCSPCVAMYPQERELAKKLEHERFEMLSVNADEDVGTLKKSIASGEVTWRCWWDGGMDGPITTRWGISAIPEIFILDKAGVIRFRDLRGDKLEKAVVSLLQKSSNDNNIKK
jgi:thiol-disulfide isomerase/thioredoxin